MSALPTRVAATLSGVALVLATATAPGAHAATAATAPGANATTAAPAGTAPAPVTLTLVTGDVIDYTPSRNSGAPSVAIRRQAARPDGAEVTFATLPSRDGGYLVLPSDAAAMVASGALDEELFDVETLAREQRDSTIGLLVTYKGDPAPSALAKSAAALPAAANVRVLDSVNGAAMTVPTGETAAFWTGLRTTKKATGEIAKIWLDRKTHVSLDKSVPLIGAPKGWEKGYDGKGVKVAVLDTGIDVNHPDFAGRILATENFSGAAGIADRKGHGTHVASTIAGAGATYKGVAPAASLLVGKVLDDNGDGSWSWAIAGMEWAAAQGADVVNMSLGSCCGNGTDPMSLSLNELTKRHGTLFVAAAGNKYDPLTISVPAAADEALAVGAVDKTTGTTLADFSSKGPRLDDAAVKPNIVAPGVDIVAARSADSTLPGLPGLPDGDKYTTFSGTSMATPHVAGAAAILAQQHPAWRAGELRDALTSTAERNDGHNWFEQGSGLVNVARAVTQTVFATSAVDFRLVGGAATRQVTYRNIGAAAVTLSVSLVTRGWSGKPAPGGAIRLGTETVTVPANGTATVDLTVDPAAGPVGAYGGWVTASGGDTRLVTPFSYYTGPATHRLGVSLVNSYGTKEFFPGYQAEPLVYAIPLKRPNSPEDPFNPYGYYYLRTDFAGTGEFHLPAGDYEVIGVLPENRIANRSSWVIETITLDGDQTVTLDARKTVRIRPDLPNPADGAGHAYYVRTFDDRTLPISVYGGAAGGGHDLYVSPVSSVKAGKVRLSHQWDLEPPVLTSAKAGQITLDPAYDMDTMRNLSTITTYPIVSVGQGRPEDFAGVDVTGKVVLAGVPLAGGDRPYVTAGALMDEAGTNAARRGAAGILAFLDADGGQARVPSGGSFQRLGLTAAEGRAVRSALAKGPLSLRLEPYAGPEVVYHMRFDSRGKVPAQPPKVEMVHLVRVDAAYHADKPDTSGWEYGESSTGEEPGRLVYGGSLRMPVARTEYFGPMSNDVVWSRTITNAGLDLRSDDRFTRQERQRAERWFKAPLVPGAANVPADYPVELPCALCRDGDRFIPAEQWRDSDPRHYSGLGPMTSSPRLFIGNREIPVQGRRPRSFTVPGQAGQYRLETIDTTDRTLSRKVTTTSRFTSTPPSPGAPDGYTCTFGTACAFQPVPQITYDLPLDLLNRAAAGQRYAFELRAPTVAKVEYSVNDGTSWQEAAGVTPVSDGRYFITLTHPPLAQTSGYVSLRVTASDRAGGSTTQTIDRAYGLR
ncbi:Serine protease, subtilisin family [Nonomuraea solani]|uniref:Serine protease, subtilisin family n=1 Tax=Nonomuraea solani TaxID=1144553 RepID=A0A1H6EYA3_9ACTN|nr:S8 family serine peptidase [Nonomuraea solani]SEH02857.1 Serine protease, subtilisin family [Nonomuraea solani]